jgi:hypothetical protein
MRTHTRIDAARALLRRAASLATPRGFPAWIDSAENGLVTPVVMPRVRDALVLRLVAGRRVERAGRFFDATRAA